MSRVNDFLIDITSSLTVPFRKGKSLYFIPIFLFNILLLTKLVNSIPASLIQLLVWVGCFYFILYFILEGLNLSRQKKIQTDMENLILITISMTIGLIPSLLLLTDIGWDYFIFMNLFYYLSVWGIVTVYSPNQTL